MKKPTPHKDRWEAQKQELNALVAKHGGTVTPAQVVAFAKKAQTALHTAFEWDDTKAAAEYRIVQAHNLLRLRYTVIEAGNQQPVRVRAFVSLPSDRETGLYRPIQDVLASETMVAELEAELLRDLKGAQSRYKALGKASQLYEKLVTVVESA